jgi:hypothetical protein
VGRPPAKDYDDDDRPARTPSAKAGTGAAAAASAPAAGTDPAAGASRSGAATASDADRRGAASGARTPATASTAANGANARPASAAAAAATEDGAFRRRAVPQARRVGEQWFVPDFEEDDPIVVRGAQVLLSEELKYQIRNENDD